MEAAELDIKTEFNCGVMKGFLPPRCSPCPWKWEAAAAAQPPATRLARWCRCASPALRPRCWTVWTGRERTAGSVTSPSTSRDMCSKPTAASWPPPHHTSMTRWECYAVMSPLGNSQTQHTNQFLIWTMKKLCLKIRLRSMQLVFEQPFLNFRTSDTLVEPDVTTMDVTMDSKNIVDLTNIWGHTSVFNLTKMCCKQQREWSLQNQL